MSEDPAAPTLMAANSFYTSLVSALNTSSCRGCFFSHFQVSSFTRALFTSLLVGRPPPSPLESSTFTWWVRSRAGFLFGWRPSGQYLAGDETPTQCYLQALLQPLVPPTYKGPGVNIGICARIFRLQSPHWQSIAQHFLRYIMEKSPRCDIFSCVMMLS